MGEENKVNELISNGTELAGASIGGALGFLAGGPLLAGAASGLGVIIAKTSEKLLNDITNRNLSKREEMRVGATAAYSLDKIQKYLVAGKQPRIDGFFCDEKKTRSDAEEIFEGVLLKAKNEHEEKKMRILANIFANIAFSPGFTIGESNHLLQIASNLTYRQMCILAFFKNKVIFCSLNLRKTDYSDYSKSEGSYYETISILQEIFELYNYGMIAFGLDKETGDSEALLGYGNIRPADLDLGDMGERYYNILGLDDIPKEDMTNIALKLC